MNTITPQENPIIAEVWRELYRASAKFPTWPTDPLHALAVVQEEVGELQKSVLELCYEPHKTTFAEMKLEAIQAAAMTFRFLMSLNEYDFRKGAEHKQNTPVEL